MICAVSDIHQWNSFNWFSQFWLWVLINVSHDKWPTMVYFYLCVLLLRKYCTYGIKSKDCAKWISSCAKVELFYLMVNKLWSVKTIVFSFCVETSQALPGPRTRSLWHRMTILLVHSPQGIGKWFKIRAINHFTKLMSIGLSKGPKMLHVSFLRDQTISLLSFGEEWSQWYETVVDLSATRKKFWVVTM